MGVSGRIRVSIRVSGYLSVYPCLAGCVADMDVPMYI